MMRAEPATETKVYDIAVLPGDGVGVDVTAEALRVLQAVQAGFAGVALRFTEHPVGAGEYLRHGDPLPSAALEACRNADAVLLGAMGLPEVRWPDGREMTPQLDLRDCFAVECPELLAEAETTPEPQARVCDPGERIPIGVVWRRVESALRECPEVGACNRI